ncbi:MAG: T9SS C-terminal target domain-containing protein [Bacteroidetes bacterium]|nr:MAG: T9SS C-terminal target domain-containing protein [Bacteroidota bacterium]REJ99799.1 MAG: T9SS C-terminal target domain-containing protein [Bacteroidota bacterium]REK34172.1 MAG: T9SS C-terminal target domain-containing protein [Bacteroidota bacterium]REK50502.1 MAG: T9SS C-terminal target domain-containing protein [Bacteroidota bacterium]
MIFFRIILIASSLLLITFQKSVNATGFDSQFPDTAWFFTFGGSSFEKFNSVTQAMDSSYLLAGSTNGYGPGGISAYLVRVDKNGRHIWSRVLGGHQIDQFNSVCLLSDGNIISAGYTNSTGAGGYDGYIVKTDTTGNVIWEKTFGGSDWDFINEILLLQNGSLLLAGNTYSASSGGSDAWLLNIDSNGQLLWEKKFGTSSDEIFKSVAIMASNIYACGYAKHATGFSEGLIIKTDFNGNQISDFRFSLLGNDELNHVISLSSGRLLTCGKAINPANPGNDELWIMMVDSNGSSSVIPTTLSPESDYLNRCLELNNGNLAFIGRKDPSGFGSGSIFTFLLDSSGNYIESHSFGGANDEEGLGMIESLNGRIAMCGYTYSYGRGNQDAVLVLLSSEGIKHDYIYVPMVFAETLSPISIEEIENSNKYFSVRYDQSLSEIGISNESGKGFILKLYNIHGQETLREIRNDEMFHNISTSGLSRGVYIGEIITSEGKRSSFRFIKSN